MRLTQFLRAPRDEFESTRASLLNRHLLPSLDSTVAELISEETGLGTLQSQHTELVLAKSSTDSRDTSSKPSIVPFGSSVQPRTNPI